jgi:hypothetical protein
MHEVPVSMYARCYTGEVAIECLRLCMVSFLNTVILLCLLFQLS